jgi:hypothetical protein
MPEESFTTRVLVEIESFGLPEEHGSNIIARVTREMELLFGGRAHVTQVEAIHSRRWGYTSYIRLGEVVEEQVQQVGEIPQVSPVWSLPAPAGTRLRPVQDNLLAMRLPFPSGSSEEGTT